MAAVTSDSEWNAAALPSPGRSPASTPSAMQLPAQPQTQSQPKPKSKKKANDKPRHRKNGTTVMNHSVRVDGAVSDSVTNTMASPHSKKGQKQRQQSVAYGAISSQNAQPPHTSAQKQRPVSMGGNMLPTTPLKEQAYAGPTFQASPAASALPMPKFFSKSVPNVAKHARSLDARMEGQKTPEREASSPELDVVSPEPPSRIGQQSPLDFFFSAQKAENERKTSMHSPEQQRRQAPPATEPRNPFQQSGKSVFLHELDGDSEAMPSPKTVPPNKSDKDAYTQSLKDLLFKGMNSPPAQEISTPPQSQRSTSNLESPEQQYFTPSPTQRSTSGPSTPTPTAEQPQNYSLHYGNRNLSPLFKAARGETPSRPSNLRQHSSASDSSPFTGQPQLPHLDPNSFSRNYLDQHIKNAQPTTMPELPTTNGVKQQSHQRASFVQPATQGGVPLPSTVATPRTGSTGSRDIKSMEDDLRRMLQVNVLGN